MVTKSELYIMYRELKEKMGEFKNAIDTILTVMENGDKSCEKAYQQGYEDACRYIRMDKHCAICEYEETKPEKEPCRDCMYSHLSKFSRRPSITNAEKFREVFGGDPQASTAYTYCPPGRAKSEYCETTTCTECLTWWGQPYEEPEDDE